LPTNPVDAPSPAVGTHDHRPLRRHRSRHRGLAGRHPARRRMDRPRAARPGPHALVADVVPPEAYGRAYGFERAMDNLGAIGGRMLALVASVGTRWAIGLSVVPGLLAAVAIVYAIRHTYTPIQHERQPLRIKVSPSSAVIEADAENALSGPIRSTPTRYSWYGYPVGTSVRCLSRRQTRCNAPDPVHLDRRTRVQNRSSAHVPALDGTTGRVLSAGSGSSPRGYARSPWSAFWSGLLGLCPPQ